MNSGFVCPVCAYPDLLEPPWDDGAPSDEICPSCGTHFGYEDAAGGDTVEREKVYRKLREEWRSAGCPWFSTATEPPADWNPCRTTTGQGQ